MKEEINITAQTKQPEDKSNSGRVASYVPFYDDGQIKIYNENFEGVLPTLEKPDVIITDPPYPDVLVDEFGYYGGILDFLAAYDCRQLIFWSAKENFPLDNTARHIWAKANRNVGNNGELYEPVYERNGKTTSLVWRHAVIDSEMNAQLNGDTYFNHPTQKPIRLMTRIVNYATVKMN